MIEGKDDALLVALIDNQLDAAARRAVETRLTVEPDLRARHSELAAGGLPFARAFDAALAEAPVSRMQAKLDALGGGVSRPRPQRRWIAAAASIVLLLVGVAIGRFVPEALAPLASDERDGWRAAVASYVSLYTRETFADAGGASNEARLGQLSEVLGVALTPTSIALPDLTFKWANMLVYDGAPLGQIVYLDGGAPVVFCIIRNGQKDAPVKAESKEGVALASWARGGRGFLVGGRIAPERAIELAGTLATRF